LRGNFKPKFETLLCKQTAILNFGEHGDMRGYFKPNFKFVIVIARPFVNMADKRGKFKLCYYFGFWRYRHFEFLLTWRVCAAILNLTLNFLI
jgi:hypothetical protein